jgi:hypothetical protein
MCMGLEVDGTILDEVLVPVQRAGSSIVAIQDVECQGEQGLTKDEGEEKEGNDSQGDCEIE